MEIKNSKGEVVEVHLKEKWYSFPQKTPVFYVFIVLIFFVLPLAGLIYFLFIVEEDHETIMGPLMVCLFCMLGFLTINIKTIIKMFKPEEIIVRIDDESLFIHNGKKSYSITSSQRTKKIVYNYFGLDFRKKHILGVQILEELPKFFSSGQGYMIGLSYVPEDEVQELLGLLCNFYGEQRFSELISYETISTNVY